MKAFCQYQSSIILLYKYIDKYIIGKHQTKTKTFERKIYQSIHRAQNFDYNQAELQKIRFTTSENPQKCYHEVTIQFYKTYRFL